MKNHHYFLLLGGNEGNEAMLFEQAKLLMEAQIGKIVNQSSLYQSPAWGFKSNDFINQAVELISQLSPIVVMQKILQVEQDLGRKRSIGGYAARSIDIDILLIDNLVINENSLIIPHPRLQERKFALLPLNEIAENQTHPLFKQRISTLLNQCNDHSQVEKLG